MDETQACSDRFCPDQVGLALYDTWRAVAFAGHWPADNPSGPRRKQGLRVQLRDVESGRFVRVLTSVESQAGTRGAYGTRAALVADQTVGWLHGGTFEVMETDNGGWEIITRRESETNKWLETHGSSGGFWRAHWSVRIAASQANETIADATASDWGGFWLREWLGSAYGAPECAVMLARIAEGRSCGDRVAAQQTKGMSRLEALAHIALLFPDVCGGCGDFTVADWTWANGTGVVPENVSTTTLAELLAGQTVAAAAGEQESHRRVVERHWVHSTLVATNGEGPEGEPYAWLPETDEAANGSVRLRTNSELWNPPLYVAVGDDHVLRLVPRASASLFDVLPLTPLKGVNLGSWLIPETSFMDFDNTFNESLCELVERAHASDDPDAATAALYEAMEAHVENWIKEEHFDWMAAHGINIVRVPLGWWNVLHFADLPALGRGPSWVQMPPSVEVSLRALDRVFDWSEERGVRVLLDLHGAPGSQNGMDHSGCQLQSGWWRNDPEAQAAKQSIWTRTGIFSLSADIDEEEKQREPAIGAWGATVAIRALMERYGHRPGLYGIELLNEPGDSVKRPYEDDMRREMVAFYHEAYAVIREYSDSVVVVFCVLYWFDYWAWVHELREPTHINVALDVHMYAAFDGFTKHTPKQFLEAAAHSMNCKLRTHAYHHALLVGEWSFSAGAHSPTRSLVDGEFEAFELSLGWFFWTLKTMHHSLAGSPPWDLVWAVDGYTPDRPDYLEPHGGYLNVPNFTCRWLNGQAGAAPFEAYEAVAQGGAAAYTPPASIEWLSQLPQMAHLAEALRQPPPPVAKLPPFDARVAFSELNVPRLSEIPEMRQCERVGPWPVIIFAVAVATLLITSYIVMRVLGIISWRAAKFVLATIRALVYRCLKTVLSAFTCCRCRCFRRARLETERAHTPDLLKHDMAPPLARRPSSLSRSLEMGLNTLDTHLDDLVEQLAVRERHAVSEQDRLRMSWSEGQALDKAGKVAEAAAAKATLDAAKATKALL